jgi:transposase InsO family protein
MAYGSPEQILTDNGKVFTGRFNHPPVEVLFDAICPEHGFEHLLTQPRSPTTTGKIERFDRSLRAEFLSEHAVFGSVSRLLSRHSTSGWTITTPPGRINH